MGDINLTKLFNNLNKRTPQHLPSLIKWEDITIGKVMADNSTVFFNPDLNMTVQLTTKGEERWSSEQFKAFLADRVPSSSRRDIDKILHKCELFEYDIFDLASVTRGISARDLFWLAKDENEKFADIVTTVFKKVFISVKDFEGGSVNSPEGINIKRYAVSKGKYGILKKRLHPYSTDVESEVAVYEFSKLFGVDCCPSWLFTDQREVMSFSQFKYDFSEEFIVHIRRVMATTERSDDLYSSLIKTLPDCKVEIQKMVLLDFVTRQTDRHLSNMALKISSDNIKFYPLYDNGRSLFYEDKVELMLNATGQIELYSSEFGPVGTYYDAVIEINKHDDISKLVNLHVTHDEIVHCYHSAGISGDRLQYASLWTYNAIQLLKTFS